MTNAHELTFDENRPDLEVRFALFENDFPNAQWSTTTRELMLDGLKEMDRRNGRRPHHDGLHPLDVGRESYKEFEERAKILNYTPTRLDYEALGLADIYHDIDVEADGEGTPEERSAAYLQAKMREFSPDIYPEFQIARAGNLIIATTAQYVGDKVLQPMATEIPPDFCAPSILYGDVGDVLHTHWTRVLMTVGKLAAEELFKLKPGDDPFKKVMGIFDKQDSFSDQRFEDWPKIIKYHCGNEDAEIYLKVKEEQRLDQKDAIKTDYLDRLHKIREGLVGALPPIIENRVMSYHEKADAFYKAAIGLLGKKPD